MITEIPEPSLGFLPSLFVHLPKRMRLRNANALTGKTCAGCYNIPPCCPWEMHAHVDDNMIRFGTQIRCLRSYPETFLCHDLRCAAPTNISSDLTCKYTKHATLTMLALNALHVLAMAVKIPVPGQHSAAYLQSSRTLGCPPPVFEA